MTSCGRDHGDDSVDPVRAEALATWLEGLDLAGHLGEAGLPTFERGPAGTPEWRDPHTDAPLTSQQFDELDGLLHSDGSEPEYAVPLALVQLRRRAQVRQELLASEWFDYETLAGRRGASVNATRFAVHKAGQGHRLLLVAQDERTLIPAFQFDDSGEVRPELEPVLAPMLAAGMDPWRVWGWLTHPAALLGGQIPEQAAADPGETPIVRHAAVRLAERAVTD